MYVHTLYVCTHLQMGYDGFFFARIDYDDFESRKRRVAMEMVWRGSASLGSESDLFTGVLFYGYGPPPGFCFDHRCHSADPPIQVHVHTVRVKKTQNILSKSTTF